jgi:hypothetical protein
MDTGDDFADTSFDAGLLPQVSNIFSGLANDDACVFCADEGTKCQSVVTGGRGRTRMLWRYCKTTREIGRSAVD